MNGRDAKPSADAARRSSYVELMTEFQGRLLAYVLSLVGDVEVAADIVQETNIVLLQRWHAFEPGTDFKAWSFRIAHFQVMAHRSRRGRERLEFDDGLLANVAVEAEEFDREAWLLRSQRLRECIQRLNPLYRDVVRWRYVEGVSVRGLAELLNRTENAASQLLFRVRERLIACVQRCERDEGGRQTAEDGRGVA